MRVATLFAFTTYYCLVLFTTCALYFHYIKFCYLCAAVIRSFYIYLLALFLTYIYKPLDEGIAGGLATSTSSATSEVEYFERPGEIGGCRDSGICRALPRRGRLSRHPPSASVALRAHCMHVATDAFCVANLCAHCRVCLNHFMCPWFVFRCMHAHYLYNRV